MAKGRPSKWAKAVINEPVWLGKSGFSVVVWDKWGRKRKSTLTISIGGLRWRPYKGKRPLRVGWDELSSWSE